MIPCCPYKVRLLWPWIITLWHRFARYSSQSPWFHFTLRLLTAFKEHRKFCTVPEKAKTCTSLTVGSLLCSSGKMSALSVCSLSQFPRAVFLAAVAGLGFAWSCSGDVCQQPSEWPHHFCWPRPAELLVGSQWLCGHTLCHNFCPYSATEQVRILFLMLQIAIQ